MKYDYRMLINYNDEKTVKYLARGKNLANTFQLNSKISSQELQEKFEPLLSNNSIDTSRQTLKEKVLEIRGKRLPRFFQQNKSEVDVIARISDITTIIRPSAQDSGSAKAYGKRVRNIYEKHHISHLSPFWSICAECTKDTQHELIYQEQLMLLLSKVLKCSLGKADTYRRAFEKLDAEKIENIKKIFWNNFKYILEDAKKDGNVLKFNQQLEYFKEFWEYLVSVSGYGFNKSHAVSYSYITFQTAYLKANFPEHFYASCINNYIEDLEKVSLLCKEALKNSIEVKLPKLNKCFTKTKAHHSTNSIYLSPNVLKGIGATVANKLAKKNDFKGLDDFLKWGKLNGLSKTVYAILTKMDFFSEINPDINFIWNYIDSFYIVEQEYREKSFYKTLNGEKFNNYAYKPVKNEKIIKELANNMVLVEVSKRLLDNGLGKLSGNIIEWQKEYLEFLLYDWKNPYLRCIKDDDSQILIYCIKSEEKISKAGNNYILLQDIEGTSYFLFNQPYTNYKDQVLLLDVTYSKDGNKMYVKKVNVKGHLVNDLTN